MFAKIDCFFIGIWQTIIYLFRIGTLFKVSGCSLVEEEVIENATVRIYRCKHCGRESIFWYR